MLSAAGSRAQGLSAEAPGVARACALPKCRKELGSAAFVCGRCELAPYCNKACQREHWKAHKAECKAVEPREAPRSQAPRAPASKEEAELATKLVADVKGNVPNRKSIARLRVLADAGDCRAQVELGIMLFAAGPFRDLSGSETLLRRALAQRVITPEGSNFVKLKLSQTLSYKAYLARDAGEDPEKCYQEARRLVLESNFPEADEIRRGSQPWHLFSSEAVGVVLCFFPGSSPTLQDECTRKFKAGLPDGVMGDILNKVVSTWSE